MRIIFKNIKELVQVREKKLKFVAGKEMSILPSISNAYLIIEDHEISDFGTMDNCPIGDFDDVIDATGKMILPTWCDSHSHIVYAGNREMEFVARINGKTYEQIANAGGGILNSAKTLQKTSEEELYYQSKVRLEEVIEMGSGSVEIKSGYGLTPDAELKMLRVIKRLKSEYPIEIKSTFLAAHALPLEFKGKQTEYIDHVIRDILPLVVEESLAEYIDVFCETGYFTVNEAERLMKAGINLGLTPKIHVNQFSSIGGVSAGVKYNALSVDHLEEMTKEDINVLKNTDTMPVALPSCSYFLGISYTPARMMLDAGLPLALATDFNPGSTPSGNMNFVISTACIKMKLTPEEAINAATINGAYAMGLENKVGSITRGKLANIMLTKKINSIGFIPYSFGAHQIEKVYIKGKEYCN